MGEVDKPISRTERYKFTATLLLKSMNFILDTSHNQNVTVENGQHCQILGTVNIPFNLKGNVKISRALVVPVLHHVLSLGSDFWKSFGIVPDLRLITHTLIF